MISKEQISGLDNTLRSAFNNATFKRMLRLELNKKVDEIAGTGLPFKQTVLITIETAEEEGWFYELIAAARRSNPGNPALQEYSNQFAAFTPIDQSLERMVEGSKEFVDISNWRQRIWEIEGQVCNIRIMGKFVGTGFLVAPDIVLTNYHVIKDVKHQITSETGEKHEVGVIDPSEIELVFDYKRTIQGDINPGTRYSVSVDGWLIDSAPYSKVDLIPKDNRTADPSPHELDYALLRVDGVPGDENRGFIPVSGEKVAFRKEQALFIAQHPQDQNEKTRQMPLQLALETNADVEINGNGTRVFYRTNTRPGSSGSPCFDYEWNIVALHHSGDPDLFRTATYNEGIPIQAIYDMVKNQKKIPGVFV